MCCVEGKVLEGQWKDYTLIFLVALFSSSWKEMVIQGLAANHLVWRSL